MLKSATEQRAVVLAEMPVAGPVAKIYSYWKNPRNYPRFMPRYKVEVLAPNELLCIGKWPGEESQRQWCCDLRFSDISKQVFWRTRGAQTDLDITISFEAAPPHEPSDQAANIHRSGETTIITATVPGTDGAEKLLKPLRVLMRLDLRDFQRQAQGGGLAEPAPGPTIHLPPAGSSVEEAFSSLERQWKRGTSWLSSISQIVSHPAYQAIIGLGEPVVPLLLADLRHEPDHWFYALGVITGENPVPDEAAGDVPEMARAWIEWGIKRGLYEQ